MALRLRRGTNAERQLITPAEGELIYTTDTKQLFVGDGSTIGGVLVTSEGASGSTLSSLSDVALGSLDNGDVLTWDESLNTWLALPLTAPDLIRGASYTINIVDPNTNEFIVDAENSTFNGDLFGNVYSGDSSVIVNSLTSTINAANINASDIVANTISALDISGAFSGQFLGEDSTIILDSLSSTLAINDAFVDKVFAETVSANLITGNFAGNMYGDDSSLLLDSRTNSMFVDNITANRIDATIASSINLRSSDAIIGNDTSTFAVNFITDDIRGIESYDVISNASNQGMLKLTRISSGTIASPESVVETSIYSIANQCYDGTNYVLSSVLSFDTDGVVSPNNAAGKFFVTVARTDGTLASSDGIHYRSSQQIGIMTDTPNATLDVNGDAQIQGPLTINNLLNLTTVTTIERDQLSPVSGSVVYNSTVNKFQGYANGIWVDFN